MSLSLILVLISGFVTFGSSVRIYVSGSNTGTANGQSWSTAYKTLDQAISYLYNQHSLNEIWMKSGTYYPQTSNRNSCWVLPINTTIYGGFSGNETSVSSRKKPYPETILDGDIGTLGTNSDNCYHVMTINKIGALNGVIIRNGNADNYGDGYQTNQMGGGIFMKLFQSNTLNLTDVYFYNNSAAIGGAIFGQGSQTLTITGGGFYQNTAVEGTYMGGYGGAIFFCQQSKATISSTVFIGNTAQFRGGAIYEDYGTNITCNSCNFTNNSAINGYGGAWFAEDRNSQTTGTYPVLYKSIFTSNTAKRYGGAATFFDGITASITYCTFDGNSAELGGAIGVDYNFVALEYVSNVFTNNVATLSNSTDNLFNGTAPSWSTYDHNYTFNVNTYLSALWNNRAETASYSDKSQSKYLCYVNAANDKCNSSGCTVSGLDGSSWSKAYYQLQHCIDALNVTGGEIWVAKGSYYPIRTSSWAHDDFPPGYTFVLAPNISIYGGFSGQGNETSRSQRNWKAFPTYLTCYIEYANSYCSIIVNAANDCLLDGFIFTNSTSTGLVRRRLAGEYSSSLSSLISNVATNRGAGVFSNGTNIVIVNSIFLQNYADKGGAVYCLGYDGHIITQYQAPTMVNVYFLGNTADNRGGAISADGYCHFKCSYCYFEYNRTPLKGGAIYCDFSSKPTLNNSVFQNNYAWEAGGAIALDGGSFATLAYTKFYNNSATWEGGALYAGSHILNDSNGFTLLDSSFDDNQCTYGFSDVYLWVGNTLNVKYVPTSSPTPAPVGSASPATSNGPASLYMILLLLFFFLVVSY